MPDAARETSALTAAPERLKQTQFELASMAYEARGGGRDVYERSSFLSLLIVAQYEVERLCVLSAMSASIANGHAVGLANLKSRGLVTYFPIESAKMTLAGLRFKKWYSDRAVTKNLTEFIAALAEAKVENIEFVASGFTELRADDQGYPAMARAWQVVCSKGRRLLAEIDKELSSFAIQGAAGEAAPLLDLLEKSVSGAYPLIDANGDVIMPQWAEQREFPRIPVRSAAQLKCRGEEQGVVLRDISINGLGLENVSGLNDGVQVEVKLARGSLLRGTVVWLRQGRAGVSLQRPFHADDPGLQFLMESGNKTGSNSD